ncbi:MAG: alpha-glycosidase [Armatimonadetes bacterium]|nr:alpha-glycosidase [Armatimonadota bacterium]
MITPALALTIGQSLIQHEFVFTAEKEYLRVNVAGTFNGWNKDADPMVRDAGSNTWRRKVTLPMGEHQYKFVLNGEEWILDPANKRTFTDGGGHTNSVLHALPSDFDTPAVAGDGKLSLSVVSHGGIYYDHGDLVFRLKLRAGDAESIVLKMYEREYPMDVLTRGEHIEIREVRVPDVEHLTLYSFEIRDGTLKYEVLPQFGTGGFKSDQFWVDLGRLKQFQVPSWVERSVFYQIFPDRFFNGDKSNDPADVTPWDGEPTYENFMGGDAAGIQAKIPYLRDLGINAIYFNPVFESQSNHRYSTTDYKKIDPKIGTNKDFASLTKNLKSNGIRTVLDGVFNHTGVNFPAFVDLLEAQENSRYKDWYFVNKYPIRVKPNPDYEGWAGFQRMPKLNIMNPEVTDYVLSVLDFWEKEASIDGWRLDVANEIPMEFWRKFRRHLKTTNQDRWILGENWGDSSPWLNGDQWDSAMNYPFRTAVLRFAATEESTPSEFVSALMEAYCTTSPAVARNMLNLVGSHDTPRIASLGKHGGESARLAAIALLTWVGTPCIYYGDEIGMEGGVDPDNRRGMEWDRKGDPFRINEVYRKLIKTRLASDALMVGDPVVVMTDDQQGIVVYGRRAKGESALIVLNRSGVTRTVKVNVPKGLGDGLTGQLVEALSDKTLALGPNQTIELEVPARFGAVVVKK